MAERLGFDRDTALTLGQAVAGLGAYAEGVPLGIIEPSPELMRERGDRLAEGEELRVDPLGRAVPVVRTPGQSAGPARLHPVLLKKDCHDRARVSRGAGR